MLTICENCWHLLIKSKKCQHFIHADFLCNIYTCRLVQCTRTQLAHMQTSWKGYTPCKLHAVLSHMRTQILLNSSQLIGIKLAVWWTALVCSVYTSSLSGKQSPIAQWQWPVWAFGACYESFESSALLIVWIARDWAAKHRCAIGVAALTLSGEWLNDHRKSMIN